MSSCVKLKFIIYKIRKLRTKLIYRSMRWVFIRPDNNDLSIDDRLVYAIGGNDDRIADVLCKTNPFRYRNATSFRFGKITSDLIGGFITARE